MKKFFVYLFLTTTFITQAYSQIHWTKDPNNPVLERGENGTWDDVTVGSPSVIYDGTIYHMWYIGSNGSNSNFGYATSTDKINWVKDSIPVLNHGGPGSWDGSYILHPTVYFDGTTYHMWYTGGGGEFGKIGYATSPDSITWTKYSGNPVLTPGDPGSWDDQGINSPEVLIINGVFHMWFGGFDGSHAQIGHAISLNGIDWEKDTLNPVLKVGMAGSWDNASASQPSVLFDGKMFYMWYGGGTDFNWKIGHAYSVDGKTWQKDDTNNPVLEPGLSVQWVGYQTVCFNSDSTGFDMWYTAGESAGFVSDIGYAYSDKTVSVEDNKLNIMPTEYYLSQNYPNPFNPTTKIKYAIPQSSNVVIKIFDILGNEIQTLVNEEKATGTYELTWYAEGFPSGVYFYRLQAGSFVETKKMVLMK